MIQPSIERTATAPAAVRASVVVGVVAGWSMSISASAMVREVAWGESWAGSESLCGGFERRRKGVLRRVNRQ